MMAKLIASGHVGHLRRRAVTVQRHILPAVNRTSVPPTEDEVQDIASDYTTGNIVDADIAEEHKESNDETPSG